MHFVDYMRTEFNAGASSTILTFEIPRNNLFSSLRRCESVRTRSTGRCTPSSNSIIDSEVGDRAEPDFGEVHLLPYSQRYFL